MTIPRFPVLAAVLLAAACAPKTEAAPPADLTPAPPSAPRAPVMATFTCPDSATVYAIFRVDSTGQSEVSLAIGDERLRLPQVVSADGARYADSVTSFWNKGNEATFARGGTSQVCVTP